MGGRSSSGNRNSSSNNESRNTNPTKENAYGFEVEDNMYPDVSFTEALWKEMAELRGYGAFEDSDLRKLVDDKVSELVDEYGDLDIYNSDLTSVIEHIQGENVTDDEYWAGYHVAANYLGIQQPRYTVLDSDMSSWDEKYGNVEQAEVWANEHEGAYIYDTWTRKYRKIGGKNWRS